MSDTMKALGKDLERHANNLTKAFYFELEAKQALDKAIAELEKAKAIALVQAYDDGVISGKNAEMRRAQEKAFLATHPRINELENVVDDMRHEYHDKYSDRIFHETFIKLLRATMFMLARNDA